MSEHQLALGGCTAEEAVERIRAGFAALPTVEQSLQRLQGLTQENEAPPTRPIERSERHQHIASVAAELEELERQITPPPGGILARWQATITDPAYMALLRALDLLVKLDHEEWLREIPGRCARCHDELDPR